MAGVVYECGQCGERLTDRRCPDCNLFTRRLGPGGPCPGCDELILLEEITEVRNPLALSHTDNLTSSAPGAIRSGVPAPAATP